MAAALEEKLRGLPRGALPVMALVFLFAFDRAVAGFDNAYVAQVLVLVGINIILAVSLNLINGFTGQLSIGHAGFMAIGAYIAAALSVYGGAEMQAFFHESLHLPMALSRALFFFAVVLAGGLSAAVAGVLVGIPTLRLRGDYLAIASLGFGEIIRIIILNIDAVGGARGFSVVPSNYDYDVRFEGIFETYAMVLLTIVAVWHLAYSTRGRAYVAVKNDEIATESLGISATLVKTEAFVVAAFFGGVAGVLFSQSQGYVHTNSFTFLRSVEVLVFVVLGGMGSITGSIVAAIVLTIVPELFRAFSEYRMVSYALVMIAMMIWRPQGLFGRSEISLAFLGRLIPGGKKGEQ